MITADTNLFIYAADDNAEPWKRGTATEVVARLAALGAPIALQVVGEFQNAARRKLGLIGEQRAFYGRQMLEVFEVFGASRSAVERAIGEAARGRLSYWDALLIAASREAGCRTLLSEDMGDGETYLDVRVLNPFGLEGALSDPAREALGL